MFQLVAEKIYFEVGEFNIFVDLRKLRARKRENIWNINKVSHTFAH